jgi:hypothetical protein
MRSLRDIHKMNALVSLCPRVLILEPLDWIWHKFDMDIMASEAAPNVLFLISCNQ